VAKKTTAKGKQTKTRDTASAAKPKGGKASSSKSAGKAAGVKTAARTGKEASKPTSPRPTSTATAKRLVQSAGGEPASRISPAKQTVSDANNVGQLSDDDLRKVKTGLTKKDLDHYRELLLEKRKELLGDVASLETDARNNSGGNLSNMPLHMADIGTDNYDQEFTLGLVESERRLLQEINEALLRIKHGTYGVCVLKGIPIPKARLDIKPWAKHSIEAARELEKRGIAV
jgi:DnaK suppressor protein